MSDPNSIPNLPVDNSSTNNSGNDDFASPVPPKPTSSLAFLIKSMGGGKAISGLLGMLLLAGGIGAGIILVQNPQLLQQKASDTDYIFTHNCEYGEYCVGGVCSSSTCQIPQNIPVPDCPHGNYCFAGVCSDSSCFDTDTDPRNCGTPDKVCDAGYSCEDGNCTVNTDTSCKIGDNGAPVCCTAQDISSCTDIVCEPPARKECHGNNGKWCTIEVNSSWCSNPQPTGGPVIPKPTTTSRPTPTRKPSPTPTPTGTPSPTPVSACASFAIETWKDWKDTSCNGCNKIIDSCDHEYPASSIASNYSITYSNGRTATGWINEINSSPVPLDIPVGGYADVTVTQNSMSSDWYRLTANPATKRIYSGQRGTFRNLICLSSMCGSTCTANGNLDFYVASQSSCASSSAAPVSSPATAQCMATTIYTPSWTPVSASTFSVLPEGGQVYFCTRGSTASGSFDKARFTINGVLRPEVTLKRPGTTEFCDLYTIPSNTYSFTVQGEVHHTTLGWL